MVARMVAKVFLEQQLHPVQTVNVEQLSMVQHVTLLGLLVVAVLNTGMSSSCNALHSPYFQYLIAFRVRFCGSTPAHCLITNGCQLGCTNAMPATVTGEPKLSPTAKVTVDGTCGSSNGGTVCGGWPNGNCCSMYGYW